MTDAELEIQRIRAAVDGYAHSSGTRILPLHEVIECLVRDHDRMRAAQHEDRDGLKDDLSSLQEDAAEVVRQWTHGSVGMLDEACGRLRDNGREGWWRGSPPASDSDPE